MLLRLLVSSILLILFLTCQLYPSLFRSTGPQEKQRILFLCPIPQSAIPRFLSSVPTAWLSQVNAHGRLVFVVGGADQKLLSRRTHGLLTLAGVSDDEYPPYGKELDIFLALTQTGLDVHEFVFKFDSDTFFDPARLMQLIEALHLNGSSPLYMGSPLHHCQCRRHTSEPCIRDSGTLYCSGAAILFSISTVKRFARYVSKCKGKVEDGTINCNSSDSRLGWCMNRFLGMECTPARNPTLLIPPLGQSWAEPDGKGEKIRKEHHFCQELTSQGGLRDRNVRPRPYAFTNKDYLSCIVFHPLKSIEDMRYVSWNVYRVDNVTATFMPRRDDCLLHVGVFTAPEDIQPRMAIRETWGKLANALGVRVTFVTGNKTVPPNILLLLRTEAATFKDVIQFSNFDDSYDNLFEKTLTWFSWAPSQALECTFVMKLDKDSYPRLMVLVRYLQSIPTGKYYIGTLWGSFEANKKRNASVVQTKGSAWYMSDQYPHVSFPPYMSGGAYVLSRELVDLVRTSAPSTLVYRIEDAGLGILMLRLGLTSVRYLSEDAWDVEQCVVDSIYDNPAYSSNFNIHGRFAADMNGNFCSNAIRKPMLSAGTRDDGDNVGIWDAP